MKIQTRVDRDTRPDTVERDSFSSKVDERGVSNISGLKTADRSRQVKTTSAPRAGGKGNKRKRKKKAKSSAEETAAIISANDQVDEIAADEEGTEGFTKKNSAVEKDDSPRETEAPQMKPVYSENALENKHIHSVEGDLQDVLSTIGMGCATSSAGNIGNLQKPAFASKSAKAAFPEQDKLANLPSLKPQSFVTAKSDSDGSAAIEMTQAVQAVGSAAAQAGGILRTAVKGTANGLGGIKTLVRRGVNVGSISDVGRIATAVNTTVANAAKDTGQQMLRTKIDKSTITDTGTETIKQGLTELRYADNTRKAVLNTARTAVNTGKSIKDFTPKSKHVNRKNSKKAVKKAGANMRKLITSKAGLIVLGAAALILVIVLLLNGMITAICTVISSLFSWLGSSSDSQKDKTEIVNNYRTVMAEYADDKQKEINHFVQNYVKDRRHFPPNPLIYELNQYGNQALTFHNEDEAIAILAVERYRELGGDPQDVEFEFTEAELKNVVDRFYDYNISYSYGNCNGCKQKITKTVHNKGKPNEYVTTKVTIYCDVNHTFLHGEVVNYTIDDVLNGCGFNEEEQMLYETYLGEIQKMR